MNFIRFIRQYGPVPRNENMYDETSFPERCNYAGSVIPKVSMILRWMGLDSV